MLFCEHHLDQPGVFKPVPEDPKHSLCHLTHLIPLISSLEEATRPEVGVTDKGDVQFWGSSGKGLKTLDLDKKPLGRVKKLQEQGRETASGSSSWLLMCSRCLL